jgi:hypothetical protein
MQPSPPTASTSLSTSGTESNEVRKAESLTYEVVTIAAMVLLLISLWVF